MINGNQEFPKPGHSWVGGIIYQNFQHHTQQKELKRFELVDSEPDTFTKGLYKNPV